MTHPFIRTSRGSMRRGRAAARPSSQRLPASEDVGASATHPCLRLKHSPPRRGERCWRRGPCGAQRCGGRRPSWGPVQGGQERSVSTLISFFRMLHGRWPSSPSKYILRATASRAELQGLGNLPARGGPWPRCWCRWSSGTAFCQGWVTEKGRDDCGTTMGNNNKDELRFDRLLIFLLEES